MVDRGCSETGSMTARAVTSSFAGFRFRVPPEVISVVFRWYLRYGLSYRDVEELLAERGVTVDHVTVYRWVQRFTPEGTGRAGHARPQRRRLQPPARPAAATRLRPRRVRHHQPAAALALPVRPVPGRPGLAGTLDEESSAAVAGIFPGALPARAFLPVAGAVLMHTL